MDNSERLKRLILELPWLSSRRSITLDQFCGTFAITKDQAIQDLTLLTFVGPSQFGGDLVDIQISEEMITVVDSQNHDNSIQFTPEELMILLSSLNLLVQSDPTNLLLKNLSKKITDLFYESKSDVEIDYNSIIENLKKNLNNDILMQIDYIDARNNVKEKILVKPISIEQHGDFKYLKGIDCNFNQTKSYRLDRILKVEATDQKYNEIEEMDSKNVPSSLRIIVPYWKKRILDKYNISEIKQVESFYEFKLDFFDSSFVKTLIYTLGPKIRIEANSKIIDEISSQVRDDIKRFT
jgi:predicted DNA-binding transcriptional regulator YafY